MSFLFGSSKETTTVPDWVKQPIMDNVAQAQRVAALGYTPYYGPDVAAFSPMQNAAFEGTNQAAEAFGMPTAQGNGMPPPQTFAGGIQGYSSAPMYEAALAQLQQKNPAQYNALMQVLQQFQQPSATASAYGPITSRTGGDRTDAERAALMRGGSGRASLNTIGSYAPGGVNTRDPGSLLNRTAASLTTRTQSAPTAADRPMARR